MVERLGQLRELGGGLVGLAAQVVAATGPAVEDLPQEQGGSSTPTSWARNLNKDRARSLDRDRDGGSDAHVASRRFRGCLAL